MTTHLQRLRAGVPVRCEQRQESECTCQSRGCLALPSMRRSATATLPVSSALASSRPPGSTCAGHVIITFTALRRPMLTMDRRLKSNWVTPR